MRSRGLVLAVLVLVQSALGFRPPAVLATTGLGLRMQGSEPAMRTALVTGSTDGIGQHTAERLALEGWEVVIHGRNPQRIAATRARIEAKVPGAKLHTCQADFASFSDVKKLAEEVKGKFNKLDLLVNNAGVFEERMQTTTDGNEFVFQVRSPISSPLLSLKLLSGFLNPDPRLHAFLS